jgi:hypothetical protein
MRYIEITNEREFKLLQRLYPSGELFSYENISQFREFYQQQGNPVFRIDMGYSCAWDYAGVWEGKKIERLLKFNDYYESI